MKKSVTVVTRTERGGFNEYAETIEVFERNENAVNWIEDQIATVIAEYNLNAAEDIDHWLCGTWIVPRLRRVLPSPPPGGVRPLPLGIGGCYP